MNCLHEVFFTSAIQDAELLEEKYAQSKPHSPLHGLSISLKDQFHVKNVETTMGYVGWIGTFQGNPYEPKHTSFESAFVKELRQLVAILYVKTAVPHTLMCGETVNHIIGYTQNPRNKYLSAGGSSGGELVGSQMVGLFDKGSPQFTASQIAANNVAQRETKKEYLDYWNSTASVTSTSRPVDAVISPAAPFAAARPGMYAYYGYTTWVNLLDYTSVVIPVTNVKAELDPVDADYKPLNTEDEICYGSCKLRPLFYLWKLVADLCSRRSEDLRWRSCRFTNCWPKISRREDVGYC